MIMTSKLLPVALIAGLIDGSVGALVMHETQPATAETTTAAQPNAQTATPVSDQANGQIVAAGRNSAAEQAAYKTGFADGFAAAMQSTHKTATTPVTRPPPSRVVHRNPGTSRS